MVGSILQQDQAVMVAVLVYSVGGLNMVFARVFGGSSI
jgi:hypothetical protein